MQLTRYEKEDLVLKIARIFVDLDETSFGRYCYGKFNLKIKEKYAFERFNNFSHKWCQEITPDPLGCGDIAFATSLLEIINYAKNLIEEHKKRLDSRYHADRRMIEEANDAIKKIDEIYVVYLELETDKRDKAELISKRSCNSDVRGKELESASVIREKAGHKISSCGFGLFAASVTVSVAVVGFSAGLVLT